MTQDAVHITQVVRNIHPFGGVSAVAYFLRESLNAMGVSNDAIHIDSTHSRPKSLILYKLQHAFAIVQFSFVASYKIWRRPKDRNTVVITHGDALGGDIYVDHGCHKTVILQRPSMIFRNPLHLFLYLREEIRHHFGKYKYVVALLEYSEEMLLKAYPGLHRDKIVRIPNGVNIAQFSVPRVDPQDDKFRLIFIGHEYERKGLKPLIESLTILPTNVVCTVVGGSNDEIEVHRTLARSRGVESRIEFLGRRTDVEAILARSDLLVLPARYESWGLVVLEAMAAGVPVLCTPVGCAEEVIHDGVTGYIIEASAKSIADKVTILNDDRNKLNEMREPSRAMALRYSWDNIANKYLDLAKKIIAERTTNES